MAIRPIGYDFGNAPEKGAQFGGSVATPTRMKACAFRRVGQHDAPSLTGALRKQ